MFRSKFVTLLLLAVMSVSGAFAGRALAAGCVIGCKSGITCIIDPGGNCFKFIDNSYAERLENPDTENDDSSVAGTFNTKYTVCAGACDDSCTGAGGNMQGSNCCAFDVNNFSTTLDRNCP